MFCKILVHLGVCLFFSMAALVDTLIQNYDVVAQELQQGEE